MVFGVGQNPLYFVGGIFDPKNSTFLVILKEPLVKKTQKLVWTISGWIKKICSVEFSKFRFSPILRARKIPKKPFFGVFRPPGREKRPKSGLKIKISKNQRNRF